MGTLFLSSMARPTSFGSTNDLFCARTKTFDPDYLGLSSPVLVKEVLKFLCASSGSLELNSPSSPESSDLSFHVTSPFSAPLQRPVPLPRTSPPRNVVSPRSRKESPSSPAKQFLQNGGIAKSVPAQQQLSPAKDQHALTNGVTDLTNQKSIKLNPAVENDSTVLPSVKQLRRNYCEQAARGFPASSEVKKGQPRDFILSQSVKDLRPSYTMSRDIDYSKKIHVRSVDTSKVQKQFSQEAFPLYALLDQNETASDNQTVKICKLCERQVFQMEQVKAEKAVWHKNCFRCNECGKQIMLDTYESHEGVLYCKPHYKQLFQPKAHFEDPEPRSSDKVDHGLDELNSVDLKSRFSVFERKTESQERDLAKSPSQVTMKKAEAILSKVASHHSGFSKEPHEQEVYRDPTVVRSDDKLQDELPKDTAKKALNIFKQMEMQAANPEALNGPKPLKRFTPPPGYTGGNSDDNSDEESEYESEEDEETDNDEDESENDVVKASDKIEDEFLKITSERAMAKNLRNKFERWEAEMEKENRLNHSQSHLSLYEEEGIEASLETTRDLKARFEALSTEPAKPVLEKPRIKVNRFV